ncbi:MAG: hypothetical protein Q8S13_13060, partial [Dehalococcoidia bacterium]|nr:hypothetical protein [Dehalococcoidia bacterium]
MLTIAPIALPEAEAQMRFDRHVADERSRIEDACITPVRAEWVAKDAPRETFDLVAASCSLCSRFVLTIPLRKWTDIARAGAFDASVLRLLN